MPPTNSSLHRPENAAAAYVRMSTEHQQYSTSNQLDVIREFARQRQWEIVKVFSDDGKSGLKIQGRNSLAEMIAEVTSGQAPYSHILVYDVSRWGRFQDQDEGAHYEFICRNAGLSFHYCAEQFDNDGNPMSTVIKSLKRGMAAEYSRELSTKVFQGACRLIQLGFKQGGAAGYGLRRMLVDHTGRHKGILGMGEHKSIQTDRVILVPGPKEEVSTVRWIYDAFVHEGKSEYAIADLLNRKGLRTDFGRPWTRGTVHEVLTNEKYIGHNVYHRTSFKLKKEHVINPRDKWVRVDNAFEAIIDPNLFFTTQGIILARSRKLSDEEMLGKLKDVWKRHGHISGILIDEAEDLPSSSAFRHRFGSLVSAYKLIGYNPPVDYGFLDENKRMRSLYPDLVSTVIRQLEDSGAMVRVDEKTDLLAVNEEIRVSIVLCRHQFTLSGSSRWLIRLEESLRPDLTIAVRMNVSNDGIRDYYLLPGLDMTWENLRVAEYNGIYLDGYQFETLDCFYQLAHRIDIEEAA